MSDEEKTGTEESAWEAPKVAEGAVPQDNGEEAAGPAASRLTRPRAQATAHVVSSVWKGSGGKDAATFEATLTLRRDGGDGAAAVALFPAGVAVVGCQGPDSVYLCSDYGPTSAVLTEQGNATITVQLVIGYLNDTAGHCLVLPLPAAPGHMLEFTVPEDKRQIRLQPAVEVVPLVGQGECTQVRASIGPVEEVRIEWASENQARPRLRAEVSTVAAVNDRHLSMATHIAYEIRSAALVGLTLGLPQHAEFLGAECDGLREWRANGNLIQLELTQHVLGNLNVTLYWEVPVELEAPFEIPCLTLCDTERESGCLALESRTNIEISEQSAEGVEALDVRDLPRSVWELCQGPPLLAYKYLESGYRLDVTVARHREVEVLVAAVERAYCQSVLVEEGQMETQLRLEVRNNQKQFLRLKLPHNAALWGVFVAGRPVKPAVDHAEHRTLIALEKSVSSEGGGQTFPVEIVYLSKLERMGKKGGVQMFLPAIDLPINHLLFRLFLPESYKYSNFEGGLNQVDSFSQPWPETAVTDGTTAPPRLVDQQAGGDSQELRPVRVDPPRIGEERRFERMLLLEGGSELRFRYKRRWRR